MVFAGHFLAFQFATPVGTAALYEEGQQRGPTDEFFFWFFSSFVPVPINYFFVLSGFVLAWIYRPGQTASGFWVKRLAKVYPVYIVTTALAFVLWGLLAGSWTDWKIVLTHMFVLQAWTPDQTYLMGLNVVMWTLSSEMFLYLLFPGLILMLVQFSNRALHIMALACVTLSFLLPELAGRMFTLREPAPPVTAPLEGFDNAFIYWFTMMFPPMRLFQFVLGMSVALLMIRGVRWFVPNIPVALVIFTGGLLITNMYLPVEARNVSGMLIPIALLVAAIANTDLRGRWTPFRSRPLLFLGKISYCFYAVHILFIVFTIVHFPTSTGAWDYPRLWLYEAGFLADPKMALPGWANIGLFLIYLLATILAAWLLYKLVEQPAARLIRARVRAARPSVPPAEEKEKEKELAVSAPRT